MERIKESTEYVGVKGKWLKENCIEIYSILCRISQISLNDVKKVETKDYRVLVAHIEKYSYGDLEFVGDYGLRGPERVYRTEVFL